MAASCVTIPFPVLLGDSWPRPRYPHCTGSYGPRLHKAKMHRNLQRAQQHTEGIWNLQKPFLLTEKFLFFIHSANTC